ncbi:MAG: divergent PAP2 family protein [Blautia sp.]|nr:divergent PAP2 family protein [Blautia sp.]
MKILLDIITNRVIVSAAAGWFMAQAVKMILEIVKGSFSLKRLAGGGGMPSTHSSTVSALAVSAGLADGFGSTSFAVALFLAIIVMYDARGIRYETGRQARILNRMRDAAIQHGEEPLGEKLEENMGHTLPEIIVGVLTGIATGILVTTVMP